MAQSLPLTAAVLASRLIALGFTVLTHQEVDADDQTDAEVTLGGDIAVQLCDYARRDGGLFCVVQRIERDTATGRLRGLRELGEARTMDALVALLPGASRRTPSVSEV